MSSREDRAVRNEDSARKINESIEHLAPDVDTLLVVCECAKDDCLRVIEVSHADYDAVRQVPTRFIVAEGHEVPGLERVVSSYGAYVVVEKLGEAASTAEQLDPRSSDE